MLTSLLAAGFECGLHPNRIPLAAPASSFLIRIVMIDPVARLTVSRASLRS
jgi:hypothetical protein